MITLTKYDHGRCGQPVYVDADDISTIHPPPRYDMGTTVRTKQGETLEVIESAEAIKMRVEKERSK